MATIKKQKYDESSIEALEGLDGVRAKPAFYLGVPPSDLGLYQLAKELVDNGVDEAQNGHGNIVGIAVSDKSNEVYVWDHGRGIPVGIHPKFKAQKRSTLEIIFSILHAGGKLFASQTGYEKSRGCFVGEQKVKLLNGKNVSFEKLYERYQRTGKNFWVYSFDIDGDTSFVPRRCTQVHKTMMTKELCEVTLDNGRKIRCTPDHPFLSYEGKYIEAQDLDEGQRLRALYTSYDKDGYEIHSSRNPWKTTRKGNVDYRTNRTVMSAMGNDIEGASVHHSNGVKTNNVPKNLEVFHDKKEHFWEDYNLGKHQEFVHKTKKHIRASKLNVKALNKVESNGLDAQFGKMVQCSARALRDYGKLTYTTYDKCRGWCYPASTVVEHYATWKELETEAFNYLNQYGPEGRTNNGGQGLNYKLQSEYSKSPVDNVANHFVAKVRMIKLKEKVAVYDLTVEGEHNYLLEEGVFVHNTHGVGAAVVNALTEQLDVYSCRDGQWYCQKFSKGKTLTQVVKVKAPPKLPGGQRAPRSGTVIRYVPDMSIFSAKAKLPSKQIQTWFELQAFIHPKINFIVVANGVAKTFYQENGLVDFLNKKVADYKVEKNGKPFICQTENVDVALQWSTYADEDTKSYINGSPTIDGGTHVTGLNKAIAEALKPYAAARKDTFKPEDARFGLLAVLNYSTKSPEFDSQSKSKGVSKAAQAQVYQELVAELATFFAANKTLAKSIIDKAIEIRKKTSSFLADKKLVQNVKKAKMALSAKLADVNNSKTPISERELFLVEGDSAGGCGLGTTEIKLQNNCSLTFGEMAERSTRGEKFYGYAFDIETGKTIPIEFDEPRLTKYVTSYIEIELDDGSIERFTEDHPFLLTSGEYIAAEYLQVGFDLQVGEIPKL